MSDSPDIPKEVDKCLQSVALAANNRNTPKLATEIIDLLWNISEVRPDLDQLPMNISSIEHKFQESGSKDDLPNIGTSLKQLFRACPNTAIFDTATRREQADADERCAAPQKSPPRRANPGTNKRKSPIFIARRARSPL